MDSFPRVGRGSGRYIDASLNNGLTGSRYDVGTGTQSRLIADLQEQMRAYKRELEKKDQLIAEIATSSPRGRDLHDNVAYKSGMDAGILHDTTGFREDVTRYRISAESAQTELAAMHIKVENLNAEVRDLNSQLQIKESQIREYRMSEENMKENLARQNAQIQSLRDRVRVSEDTSGTLETVTNRGNITIQTLQKENRDAQERIIDLENRLRRHLAEREEAEQNSETYKRKFEEVITKFGHCFHIDTEMGQKEGALDELIEKGRELSDGRVLLETQVQTLQDALNAHDLETKASRETIMRLVSEVGKEQQNMSANGNLLDRITRDKDEAIFAKENLEREVELLKERLDTREKAWSSSREEIAARLAKETQLETEARTASYEKNIITTELESFKDTIAKIISDPYSIIPSKEDAIKERIRDLITKERESQARIDVLEGKIYDLSSQLEKQCELNQDALRRAKHAETDLYSHQQNLRSMEGELASKDVLRDTLRSDKQKYLRFLQEMAEAMKMEEVAVDIGYDMNTDLLIARANQLTRLESDALVEKQSSNYNLNRKVKAIREQLKNKELHMDLLRQKLAKMEEKDQTRSALAIDRDDAIVTVQKLQRKVERLQRQLGDERMRTTALRAQLAETESLRVMTLEQRKKIDDLMQTCAKLSSIKEKQKFKLSTLKDDLQINASTTMEHKDRLNSQLNAVTDDLQSTKIAMQEISAREKQLVDFREVVARMLGLNVTTLAIPDYEIISKLEKLIKQYQLGTASAMAIDRSMTTMDPLFRRGYDEGVRLGNSTESDYHHRYRERPKSPHRSRSPSPNRHHHYNGRGRSRSPSPKRW